MSAIPGATHNPGDRRHRHAAGRLSSTHLFSGMLSRPVVDLARPSGRDAARAAGEGPLLLTTGAESNEAAIRMAKTRHRQARDRLVLPVLAWHDAKRPQAPPTARAGKGYGPGRAGQLRHPRAPNRYRP